MSQEPTVLIVDDEEDVRLSVRMVLQRIGTELLEATNGREGVEMALALGAPAMVILDIGLPDIDGWEVLRRIRSESSVPVLVLSARDHVQASAAPPDGPDRFLMKPFKMSDIRSAVVELLARSGEEG